MDIPGSNNDALIFQDDLDREHLLMQALDAALSYLDEIDLRPVATVYSPRPPLSLPTGGLGSEAALDRFLQRYGNDLHSAAYLGEMNAPVDFVHLTPENSRRMRALPVWFTLMAYGSQGVGGIVERNCALARDLCGRVEASEHFELLAPVHMNVVCFTLAATLSESSNSDTIEAYLTRLRNDGRVFLTPTVFKGIPAIRAAVSNWRTAPEDIEIAWQAMTECL